MMIKYIEKELLITGYVYYVIVLYFHLIIMVIMTILRM